MKYTLIQTNNSLILVSDEKQDKDYQMSWNNRLQKLHTGILSDSAWMEAYPNDLVKVLSKAPKLSKEVADEIGWIDVEELKVFPKEWLKNSKYNYNENIIISDDTVISAEIGFKEGFQKAQELNQKKYTEEDMINFGKECYTDAVRVNPSKSFEDLLTKFTQTLSQPQQWEVEATEINGVWNVNKIIN